MSWIIQRTRMSEGIGCSPSFASRPRVSPVDAQALQSRDLALAFHARGMPVGRPAIRRAMRLRSCSAKCGVEAPISSRTSSTLTSPERSLRMRLGLSAWLIVCSRFWSWRLVGCGSDVSPSGSSAPLRLSKSSSADPSPESGGLRPRVAARSRAVRPGWPASRGHSTLITDHPAVIVNTMHRP